MLWGFVMLSLLPGLAQADTIYLCKAYSGGMFWSSATCSQQSATIDRMVTVPDGMPWDQKVQLGEQARAGGAAIAAPPPQSTSTQQQGQQQDTKSIECQALARHITALEAAMRQPQSGQAQDQLKQAKVRARDRQNLLRC